jgi:plastocyanin
MNKRKAVYLMLFLVLCAACAGRQQQIAVGSETGGKVVAMSASRFKFEPNNIRAHQGDEVVFRITNIGGDSHNFTIKNPKGDILQSVDLPGKKTVDVRIKFADAGIYEFYCNKPFHSTMGMRGRVEVVS